MLGNRNAEMLDLMFDILVALDKKAMNRFQLSDCLGVSPQVVGRQVKMLRDKFHVRISSAARSGYKIENWGVFDREMVLEMKNRTFCDKTG